MNTKFEEENLKVKLNIELLRVNLEDNEITENRTAHIQH